MTVNELIAELQKHPPQMRVVVSGYEEGLDDISRLTTISIAPTPKAKPYEGLWQQDDAGEPALFLFGRGRDEEV
jgi:hypothetical protein